MLLQRVHDDYSEGLPFHNYSYTELVGNGEREFNTLVNYRRAAFESGVHSNLEDSGISFVELDCWDPMDVSRATFSRFFSLPKS